MRIVVIGAGLLGVATAYYLTRHGHEVTVLDRRQGPGLETSFANGGMLTPSQSAPWNTPGIALKVLRWLGRAQSPILIKPSALFSIAGWGLAFLHNSSTTKFMENQHKNYLLADYNIKCLQELRQQHVFSYDGAAQGTMKIYRSTAAFEDARQLMQLFGNQQAYELLDCNGVIHHEPALAGVQDIIVGGIYFPEDESGDAYKFCAELERVTREYGVTYLYQTEVSGILKSSRGIKALITSKGQIQADRFVLAAGSYSSLLARSAGFSLPIRPVKGYSLTLDFINNGSGLTLPIIDESRHIAITPLGERVRIAGMAELAGYDTSINEKRINRMYSYFSEIYPEASRRRRIDSIQTWTGLRPYSCDGVPIIGQSPLKNLYLNTGHGHLGWSMAVGSARLLADWLSNNEVEIDLKPYQLDRFD